MSDHTQSLPIKFYLVNSTQSLCVTHRMTLGRSQGDFVLNDSKLSSLHCEFIPKQLSLSVRDLNSTNGVFVNRQKIFPGTEVKLETGDHLVIGSSEYVFFDNEEDKNRFHHDIDHTARRTKFYAKKVIGPFTPVYLIVLALSLGSFVYNLHLDLTVPKELEFLGSLYQTLIFTNGIQLLVLTAGLALVHALLMVLFKKSMFTKLIVTAATLGLYFFSVHLRSGPVWFVKDYLTSRQTILVDNKNVHAITRLKEIINADEGLLECAKKLEPLLTEEQKKVLSEDLTKLRKLASKKMDTVT